MNGDIAIGWMRRGRIDADNWQAADVPLDEESLGFRVEVLTSGGEVLRRMETTAAGMIYSTLEEETDFGGTQAALMLRIRQKGRLVALGMPFEASVAVL